MGPNWIQDGSQNELSRLCLATFRARASDMLGVLQSTSCILGTGVGDGWRATFLTLEYQEKCSPRVGDHFFDLRVPGKMLSRAGGPLFNILLQN